MSDAKNLVEEHAELKEKAKESAIEITALNELLDEANGQFKKSAETIADLESQLSQTSEELEKAQLETEELTIKVEKLTDEEASVEVKVIETCQDLGVQPVSASASVEEHNFAAEFSSISDPAEKTKYYREHKEQILGGIN
jgi:predicted nuclease with TOPRIM domain